LSDLTYAYCLVRRPRRPDLSGAADGIPGGTDLRALDAGRGLWLIAASVPSRDYDERAVAKGLQKLDWVSRHAMAHEAVVEHFLDAPAVLPMQLFTLFTSDERALAHVARGRARIDRILKRIDRQLEWGLRLTFDEKAARAVIEAKHDAGGAARSRKTAPGGAKRTSGPPAVSGAAYLERKRDLFDVTRVQLAQARSQADRLFRAMRREATDALRRRAMEQAAPGSRLLLDAAFLVPKRRSGAFRSALRKHARQLDAAGVVMSLTGPWPPYNFVAKSR
jgi:hypothetical protein